MIKLSKKLAFPLLAVALALGACDKTVLTEPLADKGVHYIHFMGVGGTTGDNFKSNSNLAFDPTLTDATVEGQLEFVTDKVINNDITVTLGVDPAKMTAYNATVTNPANRYEILPANAYSLPTTPVVIKAGNTLSEIFSITFHPNLIDPSKNYMLPIVIKTITGAPAGVIAASSTGVAYFHLIGNPLAGTYAATGYFYHPSSPRAISATKQLSAVDAETLLVELGDLGFAGYQAYLKVDANNHVTITAAPGAAGAPYTQFDTALPSTNPGYTAAWPGSAASNNTYDPVTKTFYLRYGYLGGSGWRVTEEKLVKQ